MSGTFGAGSQFALGSTTVTEVTNISFPGISSDTLDTTTHNTTDYFRTFVKGLSDGGEIAVEGNMNYTDYNTLYTAATSQSAQTATIVVPTSPSSSRWQASVFVTGLEGGSPHDDLIDFSSTLKVSGKPLFTKI
jgi:predicted secreted protein